MQTRDNLINDVFSHFYKNLIIALTSVILGQFSLQAHEKNGMILLFTGWRIRLLVNPCHELCPHCWLGAYSPFNTAWRNFFLSGNFRPISRYTWFLYTPHIHRITRMVWGKRRFRWLGLQVTPPYPFITPCDLREFCRTELQGGKWTATGNVYCLEDRITVG